MKKWICMALAVTLVAMSMTALAVPPSITVPDIPEPGPSQSEQSTNRPTNPSRTTAPAATAAPATTTAGEIAKADSVTITSSNENVSVSVPTTLPSAALAQTANAIAAATSIKTVVSAEVAASAQTILGADVSLDDLKPRINVPLDITIKGDEDATVRLDLSKQIAAVKAEVGAHILGLVTMISGSSVSYDAAPSTYLGEGKVDVDFTAEQLTKMATADEVMYTLMSD